MADINLDKGKTMLLMAGFSTSGIGQNPVAKERQTLERAREVLDAARNAGVFVGYCISHFRPGLPEVSDRNTTRAELFSYLLFAHEFAQELLELGEADARQWLAESHEDGVWQLGPLPRG